MLNAVHIRRLQIVLTAGCRKRFDTVIVRYGPVAQLGERCVRNAEVESSILFGSTRWTLDEHLLFQRRFCRKGVAVMSEQNPRVKALYLDPRVFIYL